MEWLFYIVSGFVLLRLGISLFNLFSKPWLRLQEPVYPLRMLTILIPARNESDNLPNLLDQLVSLDYPDYEVIVLNDHSDDGTEAVLQAYTSRYSCIRYINGKTLPADWLGKNWACFQLADTATGAYLLFLDADVAHLKTGLIKSSLAVMQKRKLALLSLFPDQIMKSWGEKIVVPIMHYLLLSLLPLWAIYYLRFPTMAAANGQFMLFDSAVYHQFQWHRQVRQVIVEDIAIMQAVKKSGLTGMTLLANGFISCRMYEDFYGGINGFSKNILSGFGHNVTGLLVYLLVIYFAWLPLLFYIPPQWIGGVLGGILCIRMAISLASGQPVWNNLWLHPLQMLSLVGISLLSIYKKLIGKNEWKGRNLQLRRQ